MPPWTKGIDQKTGKPLDYDPNKDIQTYAGVGNLVPGEPFKKVCPRRPVATTTGHRHIVRALGWSTSRR